MNNIVASCALLVTVVAAYNFEDPEFNRLLASDIDYLSETYRSDAHPRTRRDGAAAQEDEKCSPHKRWGRMCCGEEISKKIHVGNKEMKRECFKELNGMEKSQKLDPFSCDNMEQRKKNIICTFECVGKKMSSLDSEGNIKPEEFESFVKENFASESWLEPMQDKVISTCLDEAKNATANRDASDSSSCNPAGAQAVHCLFREIQLNCPADQIKDERSCARLRERIRGRDFFQTSPPPPPGAMEEPDN